MSTARTFRWAGGVVLVAAMLVIVPTSALADVTPAPSWSPVAVTGPTVVPPVSNEVQRVAISAEGGTYTLTFEGQTTSAIPYDAEAPELEAKLDALPTIGGAGGSVSVVGGPGGPGAESPYGVTFAGGLADIDVPEMTGDGSALSGQAPSLNLLTAVPGGPGRSILAVYGQNIGGAQSSGPVTVTVKLPATLTTTGAATGTGWICPGAADLQVVTCTSSAVVGPSATTEPVQVPIRTVTGTANIEEAEIEVSGGEAPAATYRAPITTSSVRAKPGFQAFRAGAFDADGAPSTQAGAHPFSASAAVFVNTVVAPSGKVVPAGEPRNIRVNLPPGFLGNPTAVPACEGNGAGPTECLLGLESIVGVAQPIVQEFGSPGSTSSVKNVHKPFGFPGKFEFLALDERISTLGSLRSDEDYGLSIESPKTPQVYAVFGSFFTFWGAPAESIHDSQRCKGTTCGFPGPSVNTAFLTNPTDCAGEAVASPVTSLDLDTWLEPGIYSSTGNTLPPVTGCSQLHFAAGFKFEPSDSKSDSPASFKTELSVPSDGLTDPSKLTTPEIKKTVVKLPEGVVLNASGANALESCSEQQVGLINELDPTTGLPTPLAMPNPIRFDKDPNQCPDASKVGTGELTTALLEEPLRGNLYLADQGKGNPFGSLFALYLVIEDPSTGIVFKLPGRIDPDPRTGQMTVTFENLPQLPFTNLKLVLKGGNRSALASPTTCGTYTSTATDIPWSYPESGPPTESASSFEINQGPGGGGCAKTPQERPFDLGWKAGAENTVAGASGPFEFQISRPDGSQELETLELSTPRGVSASLRDIPYCTEAQIKQIDGRTGKEEQENPACPAASQVGTTLTGAGSGPTPFYVGGKVYLSGPYKGAPVSVVAVTPAIAGPFDLGNVVVRSALFVNPTTAQITAKTDPIPQILDGVELRVRDVRIRLDRKDWTINPTSCEPSSAGLTADGNSGAIATRSARFQVGNCGALAFHPRLKLSLKGGTKRNRYPALTATLTQAEGQANISSVAVRLPHSEFLEQGHIGTICTRVQFNAVPRACPAKSIYGHAEALSPLLGYKLSGPVYLRSSAHKLPDLVAALQGPAEQPIEIDLDGRIDSVHGGIRSSFDLVPDVPVSKFVLRMQGGKKGLLVNSENLCQIGRRKRRAAVLMAGQNNKVADRVPVLADQCGNGNNRGQKKHKHQGKAKSRDHGQHGKNKDAVRSALLRRLGSGW